MKCAIIKTIFIASLVIFLEQQVTAQFLEPECGAVRITKRMINGTVAEKGLYPWMAYIHRRRHLLCGGTVITPWFVLTAAHCLIETTGLVVSLGVYETRDLNRSRLYRVDRFFKHWSFVPNVDGSDIGLLKLARKVEFSAHIRPICIETDSKLKATRFSWFLAIGWGLTEPGGKQSSVLQTKVMERRDKSECKCLDTDICTVAESGTTCSGDSGGPVVRELKFQKKSRYVQLGVSSFGVGDACQDHAVFTSVVSHTMWIQFIVGFHTPNDG